MLWTAAQVTSAVDGLLRGPDATFAGVSIDSRRIGTEQLFIPIRAERDGHRYIDTALAHGAAGYLCASSWARGDRGGQEMGPGIASIEVADTALALLDLGRAARNRLPDQVIGITGSVGKTTTKDLLAGALSTEKRVSASEGSFNNELGVPMTLANAAGDTEVAVVEMGARGQGHIALLCAVARPTIAVVTVVAAAHTEMFGSLDAVARAKAELVESVSPAGTAILNADDPRVAAMASRTAGALILFSAGGDRSADVAAEDVRVGEDLRVSFTMRSPWGSVSLEPNVRGEHQVVNVLAAATAAASCGVGLDAIAHGLSAATSSPWRMDLVRSASGVLVLNDSYNANPTSMAAGLRALARIPARRRFAVLGEMAELGDLADVEHHRVADLGRDLGISLVAVGTSRYGIDPVLSIGGVADRLGELCSGDAVLVKGSRVAGLERVVEILIGTGRPQLDPAG